jgi:hemoglobin-like flavoprotein
MMERRRKKSWEDKVGLVRDSYLRVKDRPDFASDFYKNLFFLKPKLKEYFVKTDFEHQDKALLHGLNFIISFLDQKDTHARQQVIRLSRTHSKSGMNIHPHDYYYWIEALIMTVKSHDEDWISDLTYYWREVISYPIMFMVSQYFTRDEN